MNHLAHTELIRIHHADHCRDLGSARQAVVVREVLTIRGAHHRYGPLTTHIVEEAAAVADRVMVLHRGRVVAADTPAGLTSLFTDRTVAARTALDDDALRALPGVASVRRDGDRVYLATTEPEQVLRAWLPADHTVADLRVEGAGLEQALFALTGESVENQEVPA